MHIYVMLQQVLQKGGKGEYFEAPLSKDY